MFSLKRHATALGLLLVSSAVACKKESPPAAPAPAPKAAAPAPLTEVKPRVEVAVTEEGFVPARIPAKAGVPITLAITRKVERTCATEILFKGQEGQTDLPLNQTVEVTYTPQQSGEIKFGCAMGMMIGGVLAVSD
jgi:plastocyanin domain-containing protein